MQKHTASPGSYLRKQAKGYVGYQNCQNYAEKQGDIDLIMIMTQQEAGMIEFFVGSRAQEFVRLSSVPVMSIAPKELGFTSIFS